ncbi:MAG: tetratricopeptide repeat protein [Actinomycetota bacterium]
MTQFNSAAQVMPNSVLPFYCIGKVYLVTKQPNEAKSNFEKAIKLNSNFALAYSGLGEVMTAQGNKKKAKDYFQQAALIGMARTNTETTNSVLPTNSSVSNLNNGQNNSPSVPTTPTQQLSPFELELKKARSLTSRKKWQDSLNVLMPLTKSSQTTNLYIAIGDNYSGMKQWLSAQQAYRKAVDLNPNSAAAFYKLGTVMFEVNEFQTAAEAFEKSLILDQNGTTINRLEVRKMADKANERARELKSGKKRKFLGIGFN